MVAPGSVHGIKSKLVLDEDTIVIGADVTHPTQHAGGCPSSVAVVATTDVTSHQYLGSARLQSSRQEERTPLR